jgi:hypothetical protein
MMKRRLTIIAVVLAMVLTLTTSTAVARDKIPVCHVLGHGDWMLKWIPVQALGGHLGHGDALYIDGECQWPENPLPPIVVLISYYIPVVFEFFDWSEYCFPRCPEDEAFILHQGDPDFPPLLEMYP